LSNGWIFGLSVKRDEVFAWYDELKIFLVFLTFVSLIGLSFLAYRMGSYITKDLINLRDHVQVIGAGNYDHVLTTTLLNRKDETGVLAGSIEQMRLKQKESFNKIQEANDALESKISIRTAALEDKTQALLNSLKENETQNNELVALNNELGMSIKTLKEAQKQLIESEKLASLGFLVTRLSHEFNTPIGSLNTVSSYLIKEKKLLDTRYNESQLSKSDLVKYFGKFDESSALILKSINQLKTLVKRFKELDPDTIEGHYSKVNMKRFFAVVLDSMTVYKKDVFIELICDSDLTVTIDQGKLGQVLIHLMENAYVHGFKNITEGLIIVDIYRKDAYLNIEVRDNGIGMSQDTIKHIFVPFYSEELSKASNGLGLSVVYNIVSKIFKGRIECKSDYGIGTSFIIKFPIDDN